MTRLEKGELIDSAISEIEAHIELSFNETQSNFWKEILSKYSEEILIEGWRDFIATLKPRIKPSGRQADQVFEKVVIKREYIPEPQLTTKQKSFGSKVAKSVLTSFAFAQRTEGGMAAYHSDQSRFWRKEMENPEMANKHAKLAKESTRRKWK